MFFFCSAKRGAEPLRFREMAGIKRESGGYGRAYMTCVRMTVGLLISSFLLIIKKNYVVISLLLTAHSLFRSVVR